MLPVQPTFTSVTPMMLFTGQSHQALLLSHIQSADVRHYDSLLMVHRLGAEHSCLVISLESDTADGPLDFAIYSEQGRRVLRPGQAACISREDFLPAAFLAVEQLLHDRLQVPALPQDQPQIEEKPLREFYPDAAQRLKLHYCFAHRWLPAYVRSDPARFFGYFQRAEAEPTKFIQARWQLMEQNLKLIPQPALDKPLIRRVSDLGMWVDAAGTPPLAIVQMPPPEFFTLAYYVGMVFLPDGGPASGRKPDARVFTLEKIEESETHGLLCEWVLEASQLSHHNYGILVPVNREACARAVIAKAADPSRACSASLSVSRESTESKPGP